MAAAPATTFADAVSRAPMRLFQWVTVAVCMLVLICDGIDLQLLGIVAPLVIADFAVDRGTFGIAMSAALIGFGLGAWGGGKLGDRVGRRWALVIAALVFSLATVGASQADDVWIMAAWRIVGGLGFGAGYANTIAMASEWLPERYRPVAVSTLSVGTPLGGTVVGWLAPGIAAGYGWRGTFIAFGGATLLLVIVILLALRDSPSFLLARGRKEEAARAARRVLTEDVPLVAEHHADHPQDGPAIGVLHRSNLRFNFGIGITFAASALCAYGILSWATTFLTAAGFTLGEAGNAVSVGGITSMIGSIAVGLFARRYGSRNVMAVVSVTLLLSFIALAIAVETLPAHPGEAERILVVSLIGAAAALFSAAMASMYVIMAQGYPLSCRSAGIGFGIFMSRVGAISASAGGGWLLDLGHGSDIPYFATLCAGALLILVGTFVIDRHLPAAGRG